MSFLHLSHTRLKASIDHRSYGNCICFQVSPGSLCVNSSHFMHRSAKLGCAAAFSYNIIHATLSPAAAVRAFSMGCHNPRFSPSVEMSHLLEQKNDGQPISSSHLYGHEISTNNARPVAFLFDTGVDRAVHGHFMSKLMQLWALSHSGTMVSHVIFFRGGFSNAAKSSMSEAQQQLLKVVTEAIARKQHENFETHGRHVSHNSVPSAGPISMIWADDVAHTTGSLQALCLGDATFGTGYENLVGSSGAARSFQALLDQKIPHQPTRKDTSATDSFPHGVTREPLAEAIGRENATSCPSPSVLLLHRGQGSSAPRRVINVEAVRDALSAAAAELGITLPPLVEREADGRSSLDEQVELFRSFGLLLSSHSSALKNLVFAAPHAAVVEVQPTQTMTNAFLIDVHHFDVHYEISKGHAPVDCGTGTVERSTGNASTRADHFLGVAYDARRKKWRSSIRMGRRENTLGFFGSSEAAARKHDVVAVSMGRSALNFPLQQLRSGEGGTDISNKIISRWAWKCNVEVDTSILTASLVVALKQQQEYCPRLWR